MVLDLAYVLIDGYFIFGKVLMDILYLKWIYIMGKATWGGGEERDICPLIPISLGCVWLKIFQHIHIVEAEI
jgi:hypothetical protein